MHLNMLNDIHVELIHTFNPLYAVPIVAVVFCAFLVYAFGFKSPAPPPSFENEKKYSKKRKNKEVQKQSKSTINGKANGVTTSKGKVSEIAKKKESSVMAVGEKASKKVKTQSDKKVPQEKRKDSVSYEDLNDDGWVQHVSKKGRKNRKKEDNSISEVPSKKSQIIEPSGQVKSEVSSVIEETKPVPTEKPSIDNSVTEKQKQSNDKPVKKANKKILPPAGKSEKPPTSVKSDDKDVEKILKTVTKTSAEEIEKGKSKKNPTPPSNLNENKAVKEVDSIFDAVAETVTKDNAATNASSNSKSNVAFDELAGLYPETKEKKKKKVRRDH